MVDSNSVLFSHTCTTHLLHVCVAVMGVIKVVSLGHFILAVVNTDWIYVSRSREITATVIENWAA